MRHRSRSSARRPAPVPPRSIQAGTFKATCLDLMDEVATHHTEIIVTKRGRAVVKVSPVEATAPSPRGFLRNMLISGPDIIAPDPESWEGSAADPLDRASRR